MARPSLIPPLVLGGVYSVTQLVEFLGQRCQYGMYYRSSGPPGEATVITDMLGLKDQWQAVIVPLLRPVLSSGTKIGDLRIWSLRYPNIATQIYNMGELMGTVAGDPLPPQVALVLTKRTGMRGKSGRGRMYLCGLSEASSDLGRPSIAIQAAANTLAAALENILTDVGVAKTYTPIVVSLKQYAINSRVVVDPGPPPVYGPAPAPINVINGSDITDMVASDIWNTQRPRTIGVGQ